MCFGMEMLLFLFLCLGFCIQDGIAQSGNVTVCRNEEEYQECGSCEPTCDKRNQTCQSPCYPGCFCKSGLLRARDRSCVQPKDCKRPSCKENEEYYECGSQCPLTCKNYQEPIFCTKQCTKGCFCKPGYVIGPAGKCILPTDCPVGPCHENELTTDCVNPCNTCEQRGKCYYEYCNKGCDCKPGFFKNSTGCCVPANKCDVQESTCPKNEHYVACISQCNDCYSKGDCDDHYCHPGCDCLPGHFRNENEDCVPENQCDKTVGGYCGGQNEEYSECACPCNDCQSKGHCQYNCEYGCDCKKGYRRNAKGVCIPASQCPGLPPPQPPPAPIEPRGCRTCGYKCPVGEEYYLCQPTCKKTCDTYHGAGGTQCQHECHPGCACKEGLVKNREGVCVYPQQCPQVCRDNEEYHECGSACPETCSTRGKPAACAAYCVKGCFCNKGFVRGPDGICVYPDKCPLVCGVNEEFLECGSPCPLTCTNHTISSLCPKVCVQGCVCKPGYVRGPTGDCILPRECPVVCGENEEFKKCGTACPVTCFNRTTTDACTLPCIEGCFCKPGFIRGPNGKCIPPTSCPVVCGEYEEFKKCGTACPVTCINRTTTDACTLPCIEGCFCKPGFIRGPNGNCIPPTSCPVVCGEYEEFKKCGTACPVTCSNRTATDVCTLQCVEGCFCAPGYIRGPNGKCILPTSCPVVCGEYEEFNKCGTACPVTCSNRNTTVACTLQCVEGCFCTAGYIRGPNGKCILPTSCPVVCGEYEEFKKCGTACPVTCFNRITTDVCTLPCIEGCFCTPGYIRGPNGKCILPTSCPVVCGEYEEFKKCGTACPVTCSNRTATDVCTLQCVEGCFCTPGYIRGPNGKCILPTSCPVVCGEYEEFKKCGTACPATCTNRTTTDACTLPCIEGCFCTPGYIRGPNGKCILPTSCPVVCPENEEYLACGSACPGTCENFGKLSGNCIQVCSKGCFCKPEYIRGPDGKCILPQQCPVVCPEFEEYLECGPGCQATCDNTTITSCVLPCRKGCFCKAGYIRGPDGKCILPQQCPMVCQENEMFLECGSACQGTCENGGKPDVLCPKSCTRGCFCKPGYIRGPYGKCILPTQCPVVCQENEVFMDCGSPCQDTCENIGRPVTRCPLTCIKGCFCKPGYIRGPNGKCILPNRCPLVCQGNEVLLTCGSPCQRTCDNIGKVIGPCILPCIKGCFCKPGYVRGPTNVCILPTECPVVCGEYEEFKKCGTACPVTCSNRTSTNACTLQCVEGCFCKPGFIRGPDGKCIPPTSCPIVCGENEMYEKCGSACPITCSNRSTTAACTLACIEGCFCKPGYIRGPDGKCILPTSCPIGVCGENEQFFECRSPCQRTCENRNSVINCTYPCLTGCFCKPGFVRDAYGKCIDPRSCPTGPCTKENEIYNPCGPACIKTCARLEFRQSCPQQCVRGCFCKEGFVRDISSNCIRFENCPKEAQMCPTDESFYACKPTCRDTCDTIEFPGPCDDLCRPGCACRGGLVRDTATNRCVPPRQCPNTIEGRQSGNDPDDTTTTLDPKIVITVTLPIINDDEPQKETKPAETTIGITSKVTTADVATQKPAVTTTPSSATTTSEKVITQTEGPKTKQPVTTIKETVAPTVITTKTPETTQQNIPITTTPSPSNPATVGNTGQQETKPSRPIETTPSKPIETTPAMPVVTTVQPVVTTFAKAAETTMSKTVTDALVPQ